jgi:hypothetical protein
LWLQEFRERDLVIVSDWLAVIRTGPLYDAQYNTVLELCFDWLPAAILSGRFAVQAEKRISGQGKRMKRQKGVPIRNASS